ncbi:hypothetical protein ACWDPV_09490 [Gordonia sp. NPDC003504]
MREDLEQLAPAADNAIRTGVIAALTQAQRPESMLTWMRSAQVRELLAGLMTGAIPCTHEGLDGLGGSKTTEHIRSILEQHDLLARRDHYLALFERWLTAKEPAADTPETWSIVYRFATWHHLRRIRARSAPGQSSEGAVRTAKQEITEVVKFLNWLGGTHARTAETATQHDVDQYLHSGPTTRYCIRTFFVWCRAMRTNTDVEVEHRYARTRPTLSDDQRLQWIRTLMTGDAT